MFVPHFMRATRLAALGVGGGLVVTWLAAAGMRPATLQVEQTSADRPPAERAMPSIEENAQRLHERLQPPSGLTRSRRNPFQFVEMEGKPTPAAPSAAPVRDVALIPTGPAVKLVGIAEATSADGLVRTAVISVAGQLFLVKAGEAVTSRYVVTNVGADDVELQDQITHAPLRLSLR